MKICILSMQKVNNMGSVLQSFALKKMIESLGHSVEFIDIKSNQEDELLFENVGMVYSDVHKKRKIDESLRKVDKYFWGRIMAKRMVIKGNRIYDEFRKKYLNIEKVSNKYDLCVIGSDEVFNCLDTSAWGFTSQLFGNVPEANRVITYAVSCGATEYENLPIIIADKIRKSFERISAFSVRDENTREFVSKLSTREISMNFDPVIVYNFDKEIENIKIPIVPKHYCVIYSYYNRIHTEEEINAIKAFCKKHGFTPITIGSPQFWIKEHIVCSPFQCLKLFKCADFIITDTFHGTIFSSKYSKKFATLVRKSNKNKLQHLIDTIYIRNHQLNQLTVEELEKVYFQTHNKEVFNKVTEIGRKQCIEYLIKNI